MHPGSAASAQARVRRRKRCHRVLSRLRLCSWVSVVVFASAGRRVLSQTEIGFCVSGGREASRGPQNHPAEKVQDSRSPSDQIRSVGVVSPNPRRLSPAARRCRARAQTHRGLCCPTWAPAAPANPRLTAPAPSPRHWQLTSMRTWSDTSKGGLQRALRNRYGCLSCSLLCLFSSSLLLFLYLTGATSLTGSHPSFLTLPVPAAAVLASIGTL